ncbi:hypothetical protein HYFRA_00011438 [Hymenoscyphus fraxineus]|uniref:Uncharacterized protein n=1 Tax=Hymenoscyphus fraxineus TaxID=746836 RepID=A0A9N9PXA8_9HELO|nr:hypothetical protein HYFRA_00011438 [Hymenoscyphus fraxineus]
MPYQTPIFKLALEKLTPSLHLDLTKETPGLLTYCQTLTNTTLPKPLNSTPLPMTTPPSPITLHTLTTTIRSISTYLGLSTLLLLSTITLITLHNTLRHKKRANPLPCSSLRHSINYLNQRIGIQHYMDSEITRREFEGRYERVVHHDDWNAMTRTITIVEKLASVSKDGKVCEAWREQSSGRDNTHGECSDDAGVFICCNNTPERSEYVEVEKVDIDQLI